VIEVDEKLETEVSERN